MTLLKKAFFITKTQSHKGFLKFDLKKFWFYPILVNNF